MAKGPRQIVKDLVVKPIKTAAAAGFTAASLAAGSLMNPGSTPKVEKYYSDANGDGNWQLHERYREIPNPVPPMEDIVNTAASVGGKVAAVAGLVHVGFQVKNRLDEMKAEGLNPNLRQDQFKNVKQPKFKKPKY